MTLKLRFETDIDGLLTNGEVTVAILQEDLSLEKLLQGLKGLFGYGKSFSARGEEYDQLVKDGRLAVFLGPNWPNVNTPRRYMFINPTAYEEIYTPPEFNPLKSLNTKTIDFDRYYDEFIERFREKDWFLINDFRIFIKEKTGKNNSASAVSHLLLNSLHNRGVVDFEKRILEGVGHRLHCWVTEGATTDYDSRHPQTAEAQYLPV